MTWHTAGANCAALGGQLGGQLATPTSRTMNDWIHARIGSTRAWIGVHYQGGKWASTNGGTLSYTQWRSGYPTQNTNGYCAEVTHSSYNGDWISAACSKTNSCHVCQIPRYLSNFYALATNYLKLVCRVIICQIKLT